MNAFWFMLGVSVALCMLSVIANAVLVGICVKLYTEYAKNEFSRGRRG